MHYFCQKVTLFLFVGVRGYRCEVMPLLPNKVKANCQMGSVDVDVEMSRRKAALV